MTSLEFDIRKRDCSNGIAHTQVIDAVKALQGDRPYIFGGIIHTDINYAKSDDSYGWGHAQLVEAAKGVLADIKASNYSAGLKAIGELTAIKLNLFSEFNLTRTGIAALSVKALVDRQPVDFEYDVAKNLVRLTGELHAALDAENLSRDMLLPLDVSELKALVEKCK